MRVAALLFSFAYYSPRYNANLIRFVKKSIETVRILHLSACECIFKEDILIVSGQAMLKGSWMWKEWGEETLAKKWNSPLFPSVAEIREKVMEWCAVEGKI